MKNYFDITLNYFLISSRKTYESSLNSIGLSVKMKKMLEFLSTSRFLSLDFKNLKTQTPSRRFFRKVFKWFYNYSLTYLTYWKQLVIIHDAIFNFFHLTSWASIRGWDIGNGSLPWSFFYVSTYFIHYTNNKKN